MNTSLANITNEDTLVVFNTSSALQNVSQMTENSTENETGYQTVLRLANSIYAIDCILSLITLTFGVTTWTVIPRWRTFKNFAYLNVLFCHTAANWLWGLRLIEAAEELLFCASFYFANVFYCWLFIASALIYMDIVIVFDTVITRKILKSSLFAYGVPIGLSVCQLFECFDFEVFSTLRFVYAMILLVMSFCLYLRVMYDLCKTRMVPAVCIKLQVATITFLMSGTPVLLVGLFSLVIPDDDYKFILLNNSILGLHMILICLVFLFLKSNRRAWRRNNRDSSTTYYAAPVSQRAVTRSN